MGGGLWENGREPESVFLRRRLVDCKSAIREPTQEVGAAGKASLAAYLQGRETLRLNKRSFCTQAGAC